MHDNFDLLPHAIKVIFNVINFKPKEIRHSSRGFYVTSPINPEETKASCFIETQQWPGNIADYSAGECSHYSYMSLALKLISNIEPDCPFNNSYRQSEAKKIIKIIKPKNCCSYDINIYKHAEPTDLNRHKGINTNRT